MICPNCKSKNDKNNTKCECCGFEFIIAKKKKTNFDFDSPLFNIKIDALITIFSGIITVVFGIIFLCIISSLMFSEDSYSKIVSIPFFICGIAILINGIVLSFKGINTVIYVKGCVDGAVDFQKVANRKKKLSFMKNISGCIYIFGFFLFWFGLLILADYSAIKSWSDGGSTLFFFSLLFWSVGICALVIALKGLKRKS